MIRKIDWSDDMKKLPQHRRQDYRFFGRNGWTQCWGVELYDPGMIGDPPKIRICSMTSKGSSNSLMVDIPMDRIDELIDALKAMKEDAYVRAD